MIPFTQCHNVFATIKPFDEMCGNVCATDGLRVSFTPQAKMKYVEMQLRQAELERRQTALPSSSSSLTSPLSSPRDSPTTSAAKKAPLRAAGMADIAAGVGAGGEAVTLLKTLSNVSLGGSVYSGMGGSSEEDDTEPAGARKGALSQMSGGDPDDGSPDDGGREEGGGEAAGDALAARSRKGRRNSAAGAERLAARFAAVAGGQPSSGAECSRSDADADADANRSEEYDQWDPAAEAAAEAARRRRERAIKELQRAQLTFVLPPLGAAGPPSLCSSDELPPPATASAGSTPCAWRAAAWSAGSAGGVGAAGSVVFPSLDYKGLRAPRRWGRRELQRRVKRRLRKLLEAEERAERERGERERVTPLSLPRTARSRTQVAAGVSPPSSSSPATDEGQGGGGELPIGAEQSGDGGRGDSSGGRTLSRRRVNSASLAWASGASPNGEGGAHQDELDPLGLLGLPVGAEEGGRDKGAEAGRGRGARREVESDASSDADDFDGQSGQASEVTGSPSWKQGLGRALSMEEALVESLLQRCLAALFAGEACAPEDEERLEGKFATSEFARGLLVLFLQQPLELHSGDHAWCMQPEAYGCLVRLVGAALMDCEDCGDFLTARGILELSNTYYMSDSYASPLDAAAAAGAGEDDGAQREEKTFLLSSIRDQPVWQNLLFWERYCAWRAGLVLRGAGGCGGGARPLRGEREGCGSRPCLGILTLLDPTPAAALYHQWGLHFA